MTAFRASTKVSDGGDLVIRGVPFPVAEEVDVIVVPRRADGPSPGAQSLRGKPVRLERPTEPVAEKEWEALR